MDAAKCGSTQTSTFGLHALICIILVARVKWKYFSMARGNALCLPLDMPLKLTFLSMCAIVFLFLFALSNIQPTLYVFVRRSAYVCMHVYVCFAARRLIDSIIKSNSSTMFVMIKDKSLAVSCVASHSVGFSSKATALIYAVHPTRTFFLVAFFMTLSLREAALCIADLFVRLSVRRKRKDQESLIVT